MRDMMWQNETQRTASALRVLKNYGGYILGTLVVQYLIDQEAIRFTESVRLTLIDDTV